VTTDDARLTLEIESMIITAKAAFYKRRLFATKSKLNLRKK
jgi:hypothetical protein